MSVVLATLRARRHFAVTGLEKLGHVVERTVSRMSKMMFSSTADLPMQAASEA
jgi:hypothetical protein